MSAGQTTQRLEIESFSNRTYSTVSTREKGREQSTIMRVQGSHTLPRNAQIRVGATATNVAYDETLDAQLATARATRYEQELQSIGAELEQPLFGRALLTGGIVHDVARTPKSGGRPSLGTLEKSGWRVGTTFMAREGVRLHASISERARFAALRELYSGALNRFDPNPNLRPEDLLAMETGITLDGGAFAERGVQLQAAVFRHRLDDAVVRITLPNRLFRRINRDEIRSTGVELLGTFTPRALRGASITADATLQSIRVFDRTITSNSNNERRAEHNPERRANLALLSPVVAGFRATAMARHVGTQYCQHPDLGRQVELGAQTTADAALTRSFSMRRSGLLQRLSALVAIDNVGNRTVYDQCGLPQPGRTLRFGLTLG
jgi:iron complex outermembrane receptor protein